MDTRQRRALVIATEIGSFIVTQKLIDRMRQRDKPVASSPISLRTVVDEAVAALGSPMFRLRVRSAAALDRAAVLRRDALPKPRRRVPSPRNATPGLLVEG